MTDSAPPVVPAANGDVIREQDKIMLVLAYLGLLSLIPLLTVKDSDYVRWHARQGLTLFLAWVAWAVIGAVLHFVPVVGCLISFSGHVALLVFAIMGIVNAFKPARWRIPVIANIAEKF